MTTYRIRHIASGLFFIPSRQVKITHGQGYEYVKSNLSKTGKVYPRKPSMKFLGDRYYTHLVPSWSHEDVLRPVVDSEWSIETT